MFSEEVDGTGGIFVLVGRQAFLNKKRIKKRTTSQINFVIYMVFVDKSLLPQEMTTHHV